MTTPILGITELADGQVDQFATANEAFRALEAACNDFVTINLTSGNYTLSSAEFDADFLFVSSGNSVSRSITVPAEKRFFAVRNGGSFTLSIIRGATTINVDISATVLLYANGTTDGLYSVGTGSGGLNNFTDAINTSTPNATVPVSSLTATNAATNVDAAVVPKGTGAVLAQVPNNSASGGNKRGQYAVDWQHDRSTNTMVASGDGAVVGGGKNNIASGNRSTVPGGEGCTASGASSTVFGLNNTASGSASFSNGEQCTANASYTEASGYYATTRNVLGARARAAGLFSAQGDAQTENFIMRMATTNATPTALATNGIGAGATTQPLLVNTSAYLFKVRVVGRSSADAAAYEITGLITRGANAASTAIQGTPTVTVIAETGGATAWDAAVSADTTNGCLQVTVTGAASTNIKWVANVDVVEVVG